MDNKRLEEFQIPTIETVENRPSKLTRAALTRAAAIAAGLGFLVAGCSTEAESDTPIQDVAVDSGIDSGTEAPIETKPAGPVVIENEPLNKEEQARELIEVQFGNLLTVEEYPTAREAVVEGFPELLNELLDAEYPTDPAGAQTETGDYAVDRAWLENVLVASAVEAVHAHESISSQEGDVRTWIKDFAETAGKDHASLRTLPGYKGEFVVEAPGVYFDQATSDREGTVTQSIIINYVDNSEKLGMSPPSEYGSELNRKNLIVTVFPLADENGVEKWKIGGIQDAPLQ